MNIENLLKNCDLISDTEIATKTDLILAFREFFKIVKQTQDKLIIRDIKKARQCFFKYYENLQEHFELFYNTDEDNSFYEDIFSIKNKQFHIMTIWQLPKRSVISYKKDILHIAIAKKPYGLLIALEQKDRSLSLFKQCSTIIFQISITNKGD